MMNLVGEEVCAWSLALSRTARLCTDETLFLSEQDQSRFLGCLIDAAVRHIYSWRTQRCARRLLIFFLP